MSHRILITGAGGYIGSVTAYLFLQKDYEVVAIDNFCTGFEKPLQFLQKKFGKEKLRLYKLDLKQDLSKVFEKEKDIKAIIHFAAHCSVDESMKNPQKYFTNNVLGSQNLLSTILSQNINKIVFSSTCAVYGEAKYVPIDEIHPTDPKNPYGASKRMVEQIIEWYGKLTGLNYIIFRYFNVCGAADDGLIGDSKKPSLLLVQNSVRGALGIEPFFLTCPKVNTPDKTPIRDYVNVVDLGLAHIKAVEYLLSGGKSELINLGTGVGNSVMEVIKSVQKITGKKFDIKKTTPRLGEYAKMIANIDQADKVLSWKPTKTIEDSINSLLLWYSKHPHGWEK